MPSVAITVATISVARNVQAQIYAADYRTKGVWVAASIAGVHLGGDNTVSSTSGLVLPTATPIYIETNGDLFVYNFGSAAATISILPVSA